MNEPRIPLLSIEEAKQAAAKAEIPEAMAELNIFRILLRQPMLAKLVNRPKAYRVPVRWSMKSCAVSRRIEPSEARIKRTAHIGRAAEGTTHGWIASPG